MTISLFEIAGNSSLFLNKLIERHNTFIESTSEYKSSYLSIPTGFDDMDRLSGLVEHGINVIASVPSMGKTALAIDIALNIANRKKTGELKKVGTVRFLSFECSQEQFLLKLITNKSEVESDKIITGNLNQREYLRIQEAIKSLENLDFKIINELLRREEDVLDYIEQNCNEGDVVFLDSINLIINNIRSEPYTSGVDFIRHLKLLGINKKITFVVMSQLIKKVNERQGHRPLLLDLPYGVLSNHADMIAFLLRREYYDPHDKPGMAELIIAKNRHGGVGCVYLTFRKEFAQFANYIYVKKEMMYDLESEMDFAFSPI